MSTLYSYICVKQSTDVFVPPSAINIDMLARDVSDAFYSLQGGYFRVGQISHFPVQRSVPFHLLCDGSEVSKASFPELYEYLADSQGTASNQDNFVLPNFIGGALEPAPTAEPEVIEGGTVTSETPVITPDTDIGGTEDFAVDSGERYKFYINIGGLGF